MRLSITLPSSMALLCLALTPYFLGACDPDAPQATDVDTDTDTDTGPVDGRWSPEQWTLLQGMAIEALTPSPAPSNRYADDDKAAALGQMLFFEKAHSGPIKATGADDGTNGGLGAECDMGKVACESCHQASTVVMTDERSFPPDHSTTLGTGPVGRNVPGAANSVFYTYIGLSGARDSLWSVSAFATNAAPLGSSELTTLHMIAGKYGDLYNEAFDPDLPADLSGYPSWGSPGDPAFDGMSEAEQLATSTVFANYSKALGAYQRRLVLGKTSFDDYVGGDLNALNEAEKEGLGLFIGKGQCIACHSGPHFSDQGFHNIATSVGEGDTGRFSAIGALNTFRYTSEGAFSDSTTDSKIDAYPDAARDGDGLLVADDAFKGQFRTQTLRGIPDSPPYMHKGNLLTLDAVIAHYNAPPTPDVGSLDAAMSPLGLTSEESEQLVAFLEALAADGVPDALLQDTSRTDAQAKAAGLAGYLPSVDKLPDGHPCQ